MTGRVGVTENWSLTPSSVGESEGEKNSAAAHVLVIHANLLGKRQSADGDMARAG